ncbi:amidohydrolase [Sphingomonadaceae bacterium OTU29THOMA1]|nr:amidohydrolase [Sphingomonadaceae bacterium OTU29THOMA1]
MSRLSATARRGRSPDLPPAPDFGLADTVSIFERLPNVFVKLTEINIDRLLSNGIEPARVVRRFADTFGANRMMWGSDLGHSEWPYVRKAATARAAADYLSAEERSRFLFGTAATVYSA